MNEYVAIRAIIFDMGGVILRSRDETPRIRLAQTLGWTHEELIQFVFGSETARKATVGEITEEQHWESLRFRLGISPEEMHTFQETFWEGDFVDRELLGFIGGLRREYKTGLLSNAWSGARKAVTEKYHALDVFDISIFSAEAGCAKPDPAIYWMILNQLGVQPPEAIFVDDYTPNVEAAAALGIHAIRFINLEQVRCEVIARLDGHPGC